MTVAASRARRRLRRGPASRAHGPPRSSSSTPRSRRAAAGAAARCARRRRTGLAVDAARRRRDRDPEPRDVSVAEHVDDVAAILDAEGDRARRPASATASAGVVALEVAARLPGRVAAVVAYEPPYAAVADAATSRAALAQRRARRPSRRSLARRPAGRRRAFMRRASAGPGRWDALPGRTRPFLEDEGGGAVADVGSPASTRPALGRHPRARSRSSPAARREPFYAADRGRPGRPDPAARAGSSWRACATPPRSPTRRPSPPPCAPRSRPPQPAEAAAPSPGRRRPDRRPRMTARRPHRPRPASRPSVATPPRRARSARCSTGSPASTTR